MWNANAHKATEQLDQSAKELRQLAALPGLPNHLKRALVINAEKWESSTQAFRDGKMCRVTAVIMGTLAPLFVRHLRRGKTVRRATLAVCRPHAKGSVFPVRPKSSAK